MALDQDNLLFGIEFIGQEKFADNVIKSANSLKILEKEGNQLNAILSQTTIELEQNVIALTEAKVAVDKYVGTSKTLSEDQKKLIASYDQLKAKNEQLTAAQREQTKAVQDNAAKLGEAKKAAEFLSSSYQKLTADLKAAKINYQQVAATFGAGSKQAKEAAAAVAILDKEMKAINATSTATGNGFTKSFGLIRQAANILPGLGISGIFLLAFEGLSQLLSGIDILPDKLGIIDRVFTGTDDKTKLLKESLRELGDTVNDVARGAIDGLDKEIDKLNDDLGLTPTAVEKVQASLRLLQTDAAALKSALEKTSIFDFFTTGIDPGTLTGIRQNNQKQLEENEKLQLEANQKLNELNRKQRDLNNEKALKGQTEANTKFLQDNLQLEIDANNKILSNDKKLFGDKLSALNSNLQAQEQLNIIQRNKDLNAAVDDEGKKSLAQENFRFANLKAQADYNEKLRQLNQKQADLLFGDQKAILQDKIATNQQIAKDDQQLYFFRNEAAQRAFDFTNQLINLELANRKRTAVEAKIAIKNNELDLNESLRKIFIDRFKLEKEPAITAPAPDDTREKQLAAAQKVQSDLLKLISAAGNDRKNVISIEQSKEEQALADRRNKGLISEEQYQKALADIQRKYAVLGLQALITNLESQLAQIKDKNTDIFTAIKAQLEKAKAELAGLTAPDAGTNLDQWIDLYSNLLSTVIDIFASINQVEQDSLNRSIALQQQRVDNARFIAERGNAEYLALEQKRLDELNRKREIAAQKSIAIANAETVAQALLALIISITQGIKEGNPLFSAANVAATIALIAAGYKFVSSLQPVSTQFYEGTEYVQQGRHRSGRDTIPAMLNAGEAIIPTETNQQYREAVSAIYNKTVPAHILNEFVARYPNERIYGTDYEKLGMLTDFKIGDATETNKKLDKVYQALGLIDETLLNTKPVNVNLDRDGFYVGWHEFVKKQRLRRKA